MAQSRAESTRDTYNYGQFINQFPPNTIKVIWEFERIQKKICRHKMSIMFNEICIYIYVDDYVDIYSPTPVGLSSPANEVIVLPLAFIASLFIYELRSR